MTGEIPSFASVYDLQYERERSKKSAINHREMWRKLTSEENRKGPGLSSICIISRCPNALQVRWLDKRELGSNHTYTAMTEDKNLFDQQVNTNGK